VQEDDLMATVLSEYLFSFGAAITFGLWQESWLAGLFMLLFLGAIGAVGDAVVMKKEP
jgi:uncharacterized membrane protein YjjB (DUF3815 family)